MPRNNNQLRIRIPDNLKAQLNLIAQARNVSLNDIILTAASEYVGKSVGNETIFVKVMNTMASSFRDMGNAINSLNDRINELTTHEKKCYDRIRKSELINMDNYTSFWTDNVRQEYLFLHDIIDKFVPNLKGSLSEKSLQYIDYRVNRILKDRGSYWHHSIKKIWFNGEPPDFIDELNKAPEGNNNVN